MASTATARGEEPAGIRWDLTRVFSPSSIAMVGASDTVMSLSGQIYANLRRDFPGRLYPVNPRRATVQGHVAYPDVDALPEPVDLVVVMVEARQVPQLVERCIAVGHRSAYVISSGFSEAGPDGALLQSRITRIAREHGFPVLGPNCIGFMNTAGHVMANFSLTPAADRPKPGPVAIVSQSGGFGSSILNRAVIGGLGVGYFASTGNEAGATVADVLAHLVEQPEIAVLAMFAEAIRDPETFLAAADRARELDKVIISVTPGTTEAVARAVLSHTASIVGSRDVYASVCAQRGVLQADSVDELIDFAAMLSGGKRMSGRRIGVVTTSGGAGVLISGAAGDHGLDVPELSPQRQALIGALLPAFASASNPVDTTSGIAAMAPDTFERIMRALLDDDGIDAVVPLAWQGDSRDGDVLVDLDAEYPKPIAPVVTINPELLANRMPAFGDPSRAVRALAAMAEVSERLPWRRRVMPSDPARATAASELLGAGRGRGFVLESLAKDVLALYGVPVAAERVVTDPEAAARAATELGDAVALKVLSYGLAHKSDHGGVVLDVRGGPAASEAYLRLVAGMGDRGVPVEGILVQRMARGAPELAVGMYRDPVFGPVVSVGLGGRLVELIADAVLVPAPCDRVDALDAVHRIAGGRIAHAQRGVSAAALESLADLVLAVASMAGELPEIGSVDLNPVIPTADGLQVVDALFTLSG